MKINLSKQIIDLDGTVIKEDESSETPFTFKKALTVSLLSAVKGRSETGEQKAKKFELALRIQDSKTDEVDFTTEEVKVLKEAIGDVYSTLVVGRFYQLIGDLK